jgi:hypothetical protein
MMVSMELQVHVHVKIYGIHIKRATDRAVPFSVGHFKLSRNDSVSSQTAALYCRALKWLMYVCGLRFVWSRVEITLDPFYREKAVA